MLRRSSHPFDALAEHFAQIFADRISAALPKAGRNGIARRAWSSKRDMSCRYPGCKNRSKGPRFRFLRAPAAVPTERTLVPNDDARLGETRFED